MKRMFLLVMALMIPNLSYGKFSSPTEQALILARSQKQTVGRIYGELRRILNNMRAEDELVTERMIRETKDLLGFSEGGFQFQLAKRKEHLDAIKKELGAEEFRASTDPALGGFEIFPTWKPMHFLAAPGGPKGSHHVYPGGLLYHSYAVMKANEAFADNYRHVYGISLNKNLLRLAAIWHDAAKIWTNKWKENGDATENEGKIARTGASHVLSVSEALIRNHPLPFVIAIAGAHAPLTEGESEYSSVVGYLRAAKIITGKRNWSDVGLQKDGKNLVMLKKPEYAPLVNYLGDHDWFLTEQAMKNVEPALDEVLKSIPRYRKDATAKNWARNRLLTTPFGKNKEVGAVAIYHRYIAGKEAKSGRRALRDWVRDTLN